MKKFLRIYHCKDLWYFLNYWIIAEFNGGDTTKAQEYFAQIPGRKAKKEAFQYLVLSEEVGGIMAFDYFYKYI